MDNRPTSPAAFPWRPVRPVGGTAAPELPLPSHRPVLRLLDFSRRQAPEPAPQPPADADDIALVGRLALDDGQALAQLMARYWQPMVSFAMEKVRSQDAAEDLVQEAFVRVWERRRQLRPHASPRAYLYRVLRNLLIDEYRRRRLRDRFSLVAGGSDISDEPSPIAVLEADEAARAARLAIAALPERRRDVFVLAHLHGLSYKEVAEALGITTRTVANHMTLALAQLREAMAGYTGTPRGSKTRTLAFAKRSLAGEAGARPDHQGPPPADATGDVLEDPPLGSPAS